MSRMIFLTLPVKDVDRAKAFFTALGFTFNSQFGDDSAACLVISEHIFAMLGTHEKFKQFAPRDVCDTTKANEVLMTLSCDSRAEVDELVAKAVAAGGVAHAEKPDDYGMMYQHGFLDLDGHGWGLMWMDPAAFKKA